MDLEGGVPLDAKVKPSITMAESQQFSKDIAAEEFYVLQEDEPSPFDLEGRHESAKVSIQEPEKSIKKEEPKDEETFELIDDIQSEGHEETPVQKEPQHDHEELGTDFFEKVPDEDEEKKQVVEKIAGMTDNIEGEAETLEVKSETAEAESKEAGSKEAESKEAESKEAESKEAESKEAESKEAESKEAESKEAGSKEAESKEAESKEAEGQSESIRPSVIQFKPPKGLPIKYSVASIASERDKSNLATVPSKKSSDLFRKSSSFRRASGLPELMKLSKKSLLALSSLTDGSLSIPMRRSMMAPAGVDPALSTTMDYYRDTRTSRIQADSRRSTYYAELGPRYRQLDDEDLLEGFDITGDVPIFLEMLPEEEEELTTPEEEALVQLDRAPYYERHDKAAQEIVIRKIRNYINQKKLSMYFKRKKMDYVTKEAEWSFDAQTKYYKKLEAYGNLMDFMDLEKARVNQELEETKSQKVEKFKKLTSMFKKMQDREGEVGYGLINTKTGNALPDKFVDRLIRRQYTQLTQVCYMRLTFIRLKGMVQEKLDAIGSLDEIAPGFLLADYEQLKSDNRAYADKIEEKDEELTRLRAKCGNTIQVLAHLREKTAALENDLDDLIDDRKTLDITYFVVRSKLNEQKQYRDSIRHGLNKMRDDSGLLTQPTLLRDMEQGLKEFETLTDQLTQITKEYKKKATQIKTIRKKIEQTVDLRRCISGKSLTRIQRNNGLPSVKKERLFKIYKGRPSLMMPVIEDSAFNSLRTIKPKLTYDRSQRKCCNIRDNKRKEG